MSDIVKVLYVDKDKCTNCHACITACPVKFCNDGSGDHVTINPNMCLTCGNCIKACSHNARYYLDDFELFLEALENKEKIVAIVAPAIAANFPTKYLNFNGWLKSVGVEAIFDVSFGAELTVKSYVEHIKEQAPDMVIAQPCPAIVSYIQIYQPELIKHLAPADSPMLHTIKMIKEYYPAYKGHKIAVISPCAAKKREFEETGLGDFNVTYKSLDAHFSDNDVLLRDFPEVDFDNQPAERAVLFSSPGGLLRTAVREVPGIDRKTRKIEGVHSIYQYLQKLPEMLEKRMQPLLIDCLNCELGCNGGPGTLNQHKSPDEMEYYIERRNEEMQTKYARTGFLGKNGQAQFKKSLAKYWKKGLFVREYLNHSDNNTIQIPNDMEREEIYKKMHKYEESDLYNCSSCGYGTCEGMAVAIFNDLNKPENCHFYKESLIKHSLTRAENLRDLAEEKQDSLNEALQQTEEMKELIESKHQKNKRMAANLADTIKGLNSNNTSVMNKVTEMFEMAKEQNEEYKKIQYEIVQYADTTKKFTKIVNSLNFTADRINLLSLNASIESARAGEAGKRFAVVASEIKELANNAKDEANKIGPYTRDIKAEFDKITTLINRAITKFDKTSNMIAEVTRATTSMNKATNNLELEANDLASEDEI